MVALANVHDVMHEDNNPLTADPVEAAKAAGLRYYTDVRPGIRRRKVGKHFSYIGLDNVPIRDKKQLDRIKKLAIPPAWTNVWICPSPRGHIQATGRDQKGRKQYRYHERWRQVRDETKYHRMIAFGQVLPTIRCISDRDLAVRCLSREKVLATVVQLLDVTAIRVGNEEYARENSSYGLTTLRTDHVDVDGSTIRFHFRGKSGKDHEVDVRHPRLARAVKRCLDLPGFELFQFVDEDGERRTLDSADVNDYLREISGDHFTAKDFRTWHGTVTAAMSLAQLGPADSETQTRRNINEAIKVAAAHLGNTPAICRKSYVHPGVIEAYTDGTLAGVWDTAIAAARAQQSSGLHPEEIATLALLEEELSQVEDERAAS